MNSFEQKMNEIMTHAYQEWWNGLTKEELLDYMAAQKDITADILRNMFSTLDINLSIDTMFSTSQAVAQVDFSSGDDEAEAE